jgi:hypothetical protein
VLITCPRSPTTVSNQETEETQPYAPKVGANSEVSEQREKEEEDLLKEKVYTYYLTTKLYHKLRPVV